MSIEVVIESWDEEERRLDRDHLAMKNWLSGFSCRKCLTFKSKMVFHVLPFQT